MINYIIVFIIAVFMSSFAQILLKVSANKPVKSKLKEYLNIYVISAYLTSFIVILFTIYAYQKIDFRFTPMFDSLAYIFVPMLSFLIIKEKFNKTKLIGIVEIIIGIMVFGFVK